MFKSILLGAISTVLLSGCLATAPKVVDTKHVLVMPEDALIANCNITPPPEQTDYMSVIKAQAPDEVAQLQAQIKTMSERERKALAWGVAQTTNLIHCNVRLKGARDFKAKSKLEIEALEKKGK